MTHPIKRAGAVLAATAIALSLSGAATAVAQPAAAGGTSARHCVVSAEDGQSQCFGTYREAISHATGGRIADAPLTASAAARDNAFAEELNSTAGLSGLVVLGTIYQDFFFEGQSVTFTGPHDCYDGNSADYSFDIPAPLQNHVYSVRPYANCWINLFTGFQATGWASPSYKGETIQVDEAWRTHSKSLTLG
ncbi:hypothetical protein ACGFZP_21200 [Kitasatospora sp. NPDC048239]|uniref:hypothetical protein n=1 Tax=Kitasatospora sp. NPDC048239 TaxID=3364046 RepID=UPI003716EABD